MALSGSKLVVGFNVDIMPKLESWLKDHGVEVRLYDVIYRLIEDVQHIVQSMLPRRIEEKITGKARVIALFKSRRHGVILGCEIAEGVLTVGADFRLITAMGPVYTGKVESLQIEKQPVKEGRKGQQVGLKLTDFDGAKVGDLVECYQKAVEKDGHLYKASGTVLSFKK
jgi:translation initiation factor IF-2